MIVAKMQSHRIFLLLVLFASICLRVVLILSGGQFFWPDEGRYHGSLAAARALISGDLTGALQVLHSADHLLFRVIGLIPAMAERAYIVDPKIPALFFLSFSIISMWLLWSIVRALGAGERESLFAVMLLSFSSTFFYYCRHLFPYDTALALALLALLVGLKEPSRSISSLLCGLLSMSAFLTYNGYWILAAFALLIHTLIPRPRGLRHSANRALVCGVGFAAPFLALIGASAAFSERPLLQQFLSFSHSVTQGVYSEGWSLPFEYLWHAEKLLLLFWAVSLAYCLWRSTIELPNKHVVLGMTGLLFVYGTLVFFSVALERFVVYGRLARLCVPFCCILGAHLLERLWTSGTKPRLLATAVLVMLTAQAALNFARPLAQVFPPEFRAEPPRSRFPAEAADMTYSMTNTSIQSSSSPICRRTHATK